MLNPTLKLSKLPIMNSKKTLPYSHFVNIIMATNELQH